MSIEYEIRDFRLENEVYAPTIRTSGSAGRDLMAMPPTKITIKPGKQAIVPTGIAIWIRYVDVMGMIVPRSGLGSEGLILANTIGIIDSDYQGEIKLVLKNVSNAPIDISPGMRVAQLILVNLCDEELIKVGEFSKRTSRGEDGFGSTGV